MTGEFDEAVKEFTEPSGPSKDGGAGDASEKRDKLAVSIEFSQGALEYCFYPLAKLDHPAWALTEEESLKGAPTMQAFLQMVADKLAPQLLARLVNRYPEFSDLLGMLGVLYYQKYRYVRRLKALEKKPVQPIAGAEGQTAEVSQEEMIHCDECGKDFVNREAALGHLPCPGKAVEVPQ